MCGIIGMYGPGLGLIKDQEIAEMMATLERRGPDAKGQWIDHRSNIFLGHTRLAILDLTASGAQPMMSQCGRYILTFNGEIYNHLLLRAEIQKSTQYGINFCGSSDTETILAALSVWGLEKTLSKCRGMFAFGLWDSDRSVLTIGRDRVGEKPLYYGFIGEGQSRTFMFASDLNAFEQHPQFDSSIDRCALQSFLKYGYVPDPASIYSNVSKLMPGSIFRVSENLERHGGLKYWELDKEVRRRSRETPPMPTDAAVDATDHVLSNAVASQMLSDVPIGAFLSGGIDSSTVVALMQRNSMNKIKTFTVGFEDDGYNEAHLARKVAEHLGTEHTEITVTPEQIRQVIPLIPDMYSEPFADSSQLPTYLIAKLARQDVTVCLSGDGGDEIFCGYERYRLGRRAWNLQQSVPYPIRSAISSCILSLDEHLLNRMVPNALLFGGVSLPGQKLHKAAKAMREKHFTGVFEQLISSHDASMQLVLAADGKIFSSAINKRIMHELPIEENMMLWDTVSYLPGDILVKVDRAAMYCSLETRAPFLDESVVKHAWSLPLEMKLRNGKSKWILRQVLARYLPVDLFDRPKMGFGIPLGAWLRGPLRGWASNLLSTQVIRDQGFLCANRVEVLWEEHLQKRRDHGYVLWNVLMFQAWLARR